MRGCCDREPQKTKRRPIGRRLLETGGGGRNRTGVHGFAGRCITTLPPRQVTCWIVSGFAAAVVTDGAATRRQSRERKREALLPFGIGAGDESRTRDLNLGKVALYQLSYSRVQLLLPWQRCCRSDDLHKLRHITGCIYLERETSLELATSTLARLRSTN